jgi:hypothetical protein
MSGGGGSQTTTQVNKVELPEWVNKASQSNYAKAEEIAARPHNPYTGETVAGLPQDTLDAMQYLRGNVGAFAGGYKDAGAALTGLLGFDPGSVAAGAVTPQKMSETDLNPYLNPYITNVEDRALDTLDRSRQTAQNANASKAAAAGSFGGSRHGIVDAVTASETARAAGDLSATLRKEGYDRATELATGDITRDMTAQTGNRDSSLQAALANMQAGISGAGVRTSAANSLANVSTAGQDSLFKDIGGLLGSGNTLQAQEQAYLDDNKRRFDEAENHDTEQLNLLLASLGMSPYGRTETSTKTEPKQGTDWASVGLGGLSLLKGLGVFSSEDNSKTDVEKLGVDPLTKLNFYAYRYKKDPKSYPKVVGPMASEIEKKYPKAVRRVGGKRIVDPAFINPEA